MGLNLPEAAAILSQHKHRGHPAWILSHTTTFLDGRAVDRSVAICPAPDEDGDIDSYLSAFEALAVAAAYKRHEFTALLDDDNSDLRHG